MKAKLITLSVAALLFAGPSMATNNKPNQTQGQGQAQGQIQGQGQLQMQGFNANIGGSSVGDVSGGHGGHGGSGGAGGDARTNNLNVNNYEAPDLSEWVPNVYAPGLATGDCLGSASGGGSVAGFGASFGKTTLDEDCNTRRNSQMLYQMGFVDWSVQVACQIDEIRKADELSSVPMCASQAEEPAGDETASLVSSIKK